MKTRTMGFTLLEIMIVVAIIGLLAVIATPAFMAARTTSQQKVCINTLRQIEAGKEQWAVEASVSQGAAADMTEVNKYLKRPPACPASGVYDYRTVGTDATCTITTTHAHRLE